nr:ribonuclease H-like domain-containing protein [Tanacetum cinerariifolium]
MWLYKHKYNADGFLSRYKSLLISNGRSQQQGIDCDETFSPVVKPAAIQTVLSLARFFSYAIRAGFHHSKIDSSLFIFHKGPDTSYLLLHVDYIILTASSTSLLQRIISSSHAVFAMTNLGPLNYFLVISATRTTSGIFLSQTKYATEIVERAQMLNCNPCRTPVDTDKKLGPEGSRSLILLYIAALPEHFKPHINAMKRVLRYLRGTTDLGLQLFRSTTSQLIAYSDVDSIGYPATRRSTSGYCVFLDDNLLTWSSKRQDTSISFLF